MSNRTLRYLAAGFAAFMTLLAVVGGVRSYSPVPYWDMWDGTLEFYLNTQDGHPSAWWGQHNEHRILLSRILFWLDYRLFGGVSIFLMIMNYVIVMGTVWVYWTVLRDTDGPNRSAQSRRTLAMFVMGALFFWSQENNLTWGFQSQFFLAQLLPLCALVWLARATQDGGNRRDFALACLLGVLSIGTMANGVLALPLMVLYGLLLRISWRRIAILATLAISCLLIYFTGYAAPPLHGHLSVALRDEPIQLLIYTMGYLGSPFYYLVGKGMFGAVAAVLAGSTLTLGSAWVFLRLIRHARNAPVLVALLIFILFIGGTALGTAGGRLIFGVQSAIVSRYTTPALMAWLAFIIVLYFNARPFCYSRGTSRGVLALGLIALTMMGYQARAAKVDGDRLHGKEIAALALAMGINDREFVGFVFPDTNLPLRLAAMGTERGLTVFGRFPYLGLSSQIGTPSEENALPPCNGRLEKVTALSDAPGYVRMSGWVIDEKTRESPKLLKIVDHSTIIGFALTGKPRTDLTGTNKWNNSVGMVGYMKWQDGNPFIKAIGIDIPCQVDLGLVSLTE